MNNFSKIGVIMLLFFTSTALFGQRGPSRERIKTLKVAFITERLNLSSEEAQTFWPVYNEHEDRLASIRRKEMMDIRSRLRDFDLLSDEEANGLLNELIALEKEKQLIHIAYIEKLREVISAKKTFLLIKAEEDFKKRLLREIQQRRKGK